MRSKQMEESPEVKRKAGGTTGDNSKTRQRKRKKSEEDVGEQKPKNAKAKSSTPSAKKKRNNPPRFQDTPGEVRHWLLSNFRRVEKGSPRTIERNEMHGEYLKYCQEHDIEKRMTPNIFGKYIRTVFPALETCRVGPRNGQVRHYLLEKCEGGAKSPEEHRRDAEEPKEEEKVKRRQKPGARFESEFDIRESDEEQVELVHEEFGSSASSGSEDIDYEDDENYDEDDEGSYDSSLRGDSSCSPVPEEAKWKGKEKEVEVKWEREMGPDSLLRGYFTLLHNGGWTPLKEEVETKQELQREVKSMKLLVHSPSDMFVDDEYTSDDDYQIVPQYDNNTYNNTFTTNNNDHYPSYRFAFDATNFNHNNNIHNMKPRTARELYFTLPVPTDEFLRTNIFLFCEMLCTFEKVLWPFIPLHESFLEREVVQSFPHTVSPQSLAVGVAVAAAACVQGHHEFSEWAFNVSCRLAEQLIGFPDVQLPMSFMTLGALAHMWMPHEKAGEYAKRLAYAAKVMCESLYYTHTEVYQQIHNYYALLSRGEQEIPTIDEDAAFAVDCSPREEIVRTRTIVRRYITLQASSSWAASQVKKQFSNINSNNNSPHQQFSDQEGRAAKHLQHHVLEGIRMNLVNKCNELMFLPVSDCVRTHLSSSLYSVLVDLHFLLDDKEGALRMGLKLLHVLETDPVPYIVQFCYGLLELFLKCDSPEHVYTLMYVLTRVQRIKAIETFLGLCQYQLAAYNQARALLTPP